MTNLTNLLNIPNVIAAETHLYDGDTFVKVIDSVGNHEFNPPVYYFITSDSYSSSARNAVTQISENTFNLPYLSDSYSFYQSFSLKIYKFYMNESIERTLYNTDVPIQTTRNFTTSNYYWRDFRFLYTDWYRNISRTWKLFINYNLTHSGIAFHHPENFSISCEGLPASITYTGEFYLVVHTSYEAWNNISWVSVVDTGQFWQADHSQPLIDGEYSVKSFPDKTFTVTF